MPPKIVPSFCDATALIGGYSETDDWLDTIVHMYPGIYTQFVQSRTSKPWLEPIIVYSSQQLL